MNKLTDKLPEKLTDKRASLRGGLTASPRPAPIRVVAGNVSEGPATGAGTLGELPRIIHAAPDTGSLVDWIRDHAQPLQDILHTVGGVLFRGFQVEGVEAFHELCVGCIDGLMPYNERSTPRSEMGNRIYTSTAYPSDQTIVLHNEFSYAQAWPMRICFYALTPADEGGETPIADARDVYAGIPTAVRDAFERKGVMYVRRYGSGVDLSWQETFGTSDTAQVEAYCRQNDIDFEWDDERLTTRQVRPAVARHPVTGETVWFNQAHLFHPSNLPTDVFQAMQRVMNGKFPREALYGDGTPIEPEALSAIHRAFDRATVVFAWRKHDVLLLDNMIVCHGRKPYKGERTILVAMGQQLARRDAPNRPEAGAR
jgi:alpha-ketoglutarate-dependent taurine dioxygenase